MFHAFKGAMKVRKLSDPRVSLLPLSIPAADGRVHGP